MSIVDLHMHSCHSDDGELRPEEIIELGKSLGLRTLALTDHNSVKGVPEAVRCGSEHGVDVISGIEIDCDFNGVNLHLLGFGIDWTRPEYAALEQSIFDQEMQAFHLKSEKLRSLGFNVDEEAVLRLAKGGIATGEMFAEVLLHQPEAQEHPLLKPYLPGGSRSDMPYVNFYWDLCAQGKPAHVPIHFPSLMEAVSLVKQTGGVSVLAHPGNNLRNRMHLLDAILAQGVMGIEVFSTYHTKDQTAYFLDMAHTKNLLITCGSDFHGKIKPGIQLGGTGCTLDEDVLIKALHRAIRRDPKSFLPA